MHLRRSQSTYFTAFALVLALLITSCSGQAAMQRFQETQRATALPDLQKTPSEGAVSAADGAQPTIPVLTEGPSAVIVPASGGANTPVTITGSGFPANTSVNVYLAGLTTVAAAAAAPHAYANATTDASGNYRLSFVMPSRWPDGTTIENGRLAILVATEGFATRATASFDYTAAAATQTPTPILVQTPTPAATLGSTATPGLPSTATPVPARNPFVEVTPLTSSANAQLTLRGGGFPANSVVNVHLGTFDAQVGGKGGVARYGSTQTDGSGNFSLSFTMPALWPDGSQIVPGKLLILVATEDFSQQASAVTDYLVPTPTPQSNPYAQAQPASGSANTQVTVRGGGFPANTRVDLYLAGIVASAAAAAAPTSYANTTTDRAGNYQLTFVMPSTWQDGSPIESGKLVLLVATADFVVRANASFDYMKPTPTVANLPGWQARYYNNPSLRDEPVLVRNEPELHFYWGTGSPDPLVPNDQFSASWQRAASFESGVYRFTVEMDDGARLYLDNLLILESWRQGGRRTLSVDYPVSGGQHTIRLDYFDDRGEALVNLRWAKLADALPTPIVTPGTPRLGVLFDNDPRANRRGVNQSFCSGFESECEFAGCARNYRLVWGPYCREGDYPYIKPGLYRVTVYGAGPVIAGATDYGASRQLFSFGQTRLDLPGSFNFCWPGRAENGYGFETIVQSTGVYAAVDWITIEYLGARCQ